MAIDSSNINTGGAVVTVGGHIQHDPDADGFYWGTVSGVDVGCTTGGVQMSYNYEKRDIFCDQALPAVETSIISESAEVTLNMLETDAEKLQLAIQQCEYDANASEKKIGVGGLTAITYVPLKLEVPDQDTGNLTTYTFYRVLANGIQLNFERDNPSQCTVTFTAYADTSHDPGHQLFSIHQDIS